MTLSLAFAGPEVDRRKVIYLIQVLLPMAGLVLGQLIKDKNNTIPRAFLVVLLIIVPTQLLAGWVRGNLSLTNYVYVFSVYQHFQYVPLILVCGFAYSMTMLWATYKKAFCFLTPLMYIYALESLSFLTLFAFVAFVATFAFVRSEGVLMKMRAIILVGVAIVGIQAYFAVIRHAATTENSVTWQYTGKFQAMERGETPVNVQDRLGDWKLYGTGIIENGWTFLLGHPAPFPRDVKTSAHNWFLDVAYNFGVISLLPLYPDRLYLLYAMERQRCVAGGHMLARGHRVLPGCRGQQHEGYPATALSRHLCILLVGNVAFPFRSRSPDTRRLADATRINV